MKKTNTDFLHRFFKQNKATQYKGNSAIALGPHCLRQGSAGERTGLIRIPKEVE
jgi:hypothetical protein